MEPIRNSILVTVDEVTKVAAARRAAHDMCVRLGLGDDVTARAELVAVELANNILHHAGTGRLFFAPSADAVAMEIIAMDRGPGIASIARAMQDGYSTAGTPGTGLGTLRRKAQNLDIYSEPGKGTVVAARMSATKAPQESLVSPASLPWPTSVLSVPILGESVNGDSWAIHSSARRTVYMLADGLGHGIYASEASAMAVAIFLKALHRDPAHPLTELLNEMHGPMRATRGAAIAIFAVESSSDGAATISGYGCGVGNVSCVLQAPDGSTRSLVSHNGTVGHQMRRVQEFPFPLQPGTLLFLHSDGLSTHWKLSQYSGLEALSPAVIAGTLYRDVARARDDATILVSRLQVSVPDVSRRTHA